VADLVRYPPGAGRVVVQLLEERDALEEEYAAELHALTRETSTAMRDAVLALGVVAWTMRDHARAMRTLRSTGLGFGASLSALARRAALAGVVIGGRQQPRAIRAFSGRKVRHIEVDWADTNEHVNARTEGVGGAAGEAVAALAVASSLGAARAGWSAAQLATTLAPTTLKRAEDRGSNVLVTEMVAGIEAGGETWRRHVGIRRKVWDATRDRKVCRRCLANDRQVVNADEPFPDGSWDAPAHSRCRCATMPWSDDWTRDFDELGLAPGPRAGVAGSVEDKVFSYVAPSLSGP